MKYPTAIWIMGDLDWASLAFYIKQPAVMSTGTHITFEGDVNRTNMVNLNKVYTNQIIQTILKHIALGLNV